MLEQRIETLENQVAKLTTAIERLTEVLVGDNPPPTLASVKPSKKPAQTAKKEATAQDEQPEPEAKEATTAPTEEDTRKVLVELAKTKGKDIAKGVLAEFDAVKMSDVKPADYQRVIDLATKVITEEAA